ncbi:MAG: NfeD family protein [Sphingomonas adhaesiva]|uniref:NfeD family protein n=1 Tax=Sphingomonas adhaesiva TaxID=28212 RepID=UPI002FF5BE68
MTLDGIGGVGTAWLVAALLLGIAELLVPGVFLIFLAIAAAITGAATFVLADMPLSLQLLSFAAWSVATVLIGRRWYRDYPVAGDAVRLNDRTAAMIGTTARLETAIEHGRGRVIVGDGAWPATGPDLPAGATVTIVAVEGGVLTVEAA